MRLFVIAGEESGDLIAHDILKHIDKSRAEIKSVSGPHVASLGIPSLFDMRKISIMGFFEILPRIFTLLSLVRLTAKTIDEFAPDVVITIDSPGFAFQVVKKIQHLRHKNTAIWHVVAPSVWAYKPGRAKKVAKLYDRLFCILPFEPPFFTKHGLNAEYVGYPLLSRIGRQNLTKDPNLISITLGSRASEIDRHIGIARDIIAHINTIGKKAAILTTQSCESYIKNLLPGEIVITDASEKYKAMERSLFMVGKSGTNIMEAAILGTPCIVYYKMGILTSITIKLMAKIKMVTILNIIANDYIYPEFIQASSEDVIAKMQEWEGSPTTLLDIQQKADNVINATLKDNAGICNPGKKIAGYIATLSDGQH